MRSSNTSPAAVPAPGTGKRPRQEPLQSRRGAEGAAAVEFGLILPVLMLILCGIIEYGYVFYVDISLVNAAREGARVGVTKAPPAGSPSDYSPAVDAATDVAEKYLDDTLPAKAKAARHVVVSYSDPNIVVATDVTPFEGLVGFLPSSLLPSSLTASSSMRWEWSP